MRKLIKKKRETFDKTTPIYTIESTSNVNISPILKGLTISFPK